MRTREDGHNSKLSCLESPIPMPFVHTEGATHAHSVTHVKLWIRHRRMTEELILD